MFSCTVHVLSESKYTTNKGKEWQVMMCIMVKLYKFSCRVEGLPLMKPLAGLPDVLLTAHPYHLKLARCSPELGHQLRKHLSLPNLLSLNFTASMGIFHGWRSLGYIPMTTSAASNSSVSGFMALDRKAFYGSFDVTTSGKHLCCSGTLGSAPEHVH